MHKVGYPNSMYGVSCLYNVDEVDNPQEEEIYPQLARDAATHKLSNLIKTPFQLQLQIFISSNGKTSAYTGELFSC